MVYKYKSFAAAAFVAILTIFCAASRAEIVLGTTEIVAGSETASGDNVGQYLSFQEDPQGGQHISYYDATNKRLKYAWRPSTSDSWRIEAVDEDGLAGHYTDLDLCIVTDEGTSVSLINGSTTVTRIIGPAFSDRFETGTLSPDPYTDSQDIASVTGDNSLELTSPYTGATAVVAARFTYYQPVIAYQDFTELKSLKVARPGGAGEWEIETVDSADYSDETSYTLLTGFFNSVAVDGDGDIHVAFQDQTPDGNGIGELRYAHYNGSDWSREIVDSTNYSGYNAQMQTGSDSRPHMVHRNTDTGALVHTRPLTSSAGWTADPAGSTSDVCSGPASSYFEEGDKFFYSYVAETPTAEEPYELLSMWVNAQGSASYWGYKGVDFIPSSTPYTSIANGVTTDTQAVLYYDTDERILRAHTFDGLVYNPSSATMDLGADVGRWCSADYDPLNDDLVCAYYDATHTALKISTYDGATTTAEFVDGFTAGQFSSIARTSTEVLVAYHNDSEGTLHLARWPIGSSPAAGSDITLDDTSSDVGEYVSMAVDDYDRIFLVYYDRTNNALRLAVWHVSQWYFATFYNDQGGQYCKVRLNEAQDKIAIAFQKYPTANIILLVSDLPEASSSLTLNFGTLFQKGPHHGRYCDFAIDSSNVYHLIYYNENSLCPEYAYGSDSSAFTIEEIEESVFDTLGWYDTIAIDPSTQLPVAAYYAASEGCLRYAEKLEDGSWSVETPDTEGTTGFYSKILFDMDAGYQYLLYYNQSLGELRLLYRTIGASSWSGPVTLAEDYKGVRPDALITSGNLIQMCFYDEAGGDLLTAISGDDGSGGNSSSDSRANPVWTQY